MNVLKFGGTSVGSAERMKRLMNIIQPGGKKIVVLSAMSGTTNALLDICSCANDGNTSDVKERLNDLIYSYDKIVDELYQTESARQAASDYLKLMFDELFLDLRIEEGNPDFNFIVAKGELISTFLFHQLLIENEIQSVLLSALEFMRLDRDRKPDENFTKHQLSDLLKLQDDTEVFITQGFISLNNEGEIDNLGRGGSDYTASIIGAAISAKNIQIWTDVDGFQNNDPRIVDSTSPVRELSFDEAAELAYFGAKILHPSTILPARKAGIPVILKNTMQPDDQGTTITARRKGSGYKAVAAKDGITAIKIKSGRMLMAYGFIRKVFEIFEKYRTSVDMITTSEVAISATIDNDQYLDQIVDELKAFGEVTVDKEQTIIAAVGELVADKYGYARKLFSALESIPIRMISYGASSHNISIMVSSTDKVKTLHAIHDGLFSTKDLE